MIKRTDINNLFTFLPIEICDYIYQFYKPKYITEIPNKIINLRHVYTLEHIEVLREYRDFRVFMWSMRNNRIHKLLLKTYKNNQKNQDMLNDDLLFIAKHIMNQREYGEFRCYCCKHSIKINKLPTDRDMLLYYLFINNIQIKPKMNGKDIIAKCMRF
jgi:hypothetical protein|tara:strand:+ start:29 stop:502 length:474 start_codon:yes stop_codon:yes gene_type:complete